MQNIVSNPIRENVQIYAFISTLKFSPVSNPIRENVQIMLLKFQFSFSITFQTL